MPTETVQMELPERIGEAERPALVEQLMPLLPAHTKRVRTDAEAYLGFLATAT